MLASQVLTFSMLLVTTLLSSMFTGFLCLEYRNYHGEAEESNYLREFLVALSVTISMIVITLYVLKDMIL